MVQLPATAAIEYVAAGHFFPGGLLAGGLLAGSRQLNHSSFTCDHSLSVLLSAGCLQIQTNKFPGDFQDTFTKVPAGFLH